MCAKLPSMATPGATVHGAGLPPDRPMSLPVATHAFACATRTTTGSVSSGAAPSTGSNITKACFAPAKVSSPPNQKPYGAEPRAKPWKMLAPSKTLVVKWAPYVGTASVPPPRSTRSSAADGVTVADGAPPVNFDAALYLMRAFVALSCCRMNSRAAAGSCSRAQAFGFDHDSAAPETVLVNTLPAAEYPASPSPLPL